MNATADETEFEMPTRFQIAKAAAKAKLSLIPRKVFGSALLVTGWTTSFIGAVLIFTDGGDDGK